MTSLPLPPDELPTAPFPAPPPFWKHFTTSNQKAVDEHTARAQSQAHTQVQSEQEQEHEKQKQHLKYPLNLLLPPPTPDPKHHTSYPTFHNPHPLHPHPTTPSQPRLLYTPDLLTSTSQIQKLLYTLLKSLLLNYLELLTLMATNPAHHAEKLDDLAMLYENFVGVVNLLRPRQGREMVRERLEGVLREGRAQTEAMRVVGVEIEAFLGRVGGGGLEGELGRNSGVRRCGEDGRRKEDEVQKMRRLWEELDDLDDEDDDEDEN